MPMDGTAGSQSFTDLLGASFTLGATPVISSDAKYGTGAAKLGSTGYLRSTSKPLAGVGTGDFTVEFWVKIGLLGSIGDHDYVAFDFYPIQIGMDSNKKLHFERYGGAWSTLVSTVALDTGGGWTHVAVTRSQGTARMFFNGTQVATSTKLNGIDISQTGDLGIGARALSSSPVRITSGWYLIDDLRFTRGTARYTSTFTPPAAPLLPPQ